MGLDAAAALAVGSLALAATSLAGTLAFLAAVEVPEEGISTAMTMGSPAAAALFMAAFAPSRALVDMAGGGGALAVALGRFALLVGRWEEAGVCRLPGFC